MVAVALEDVLSFVLVVVDDASVCCRVEYLGSLVSGEVVDTLVYVLVEAKHPLEVDGVLVLAAYSFALIVISLALIVVLLVVLAIRLVFIILILTLAILRCLMLGTL